MTSTKQIFNIDWLYIYGSEFRGRKNGLIKLKLFSGDSVTI